MIISPFLMAIEMNVTTLQRARPISGWHAISEMNIKIFCDFILICWQWSTKWEDEEVMSLKTTFDSCNRGSEAQWSFKCRDWFSERAGGWEGLKCWSGSKTIMRLGGFIVFWKWKWDLNIFIVNRKHPMLYMSACCTNRNHLSHTEAKITNCLLSCKQAVNQGSDPK